MKRLLIANRGAIARRVIRACRELGIESVAVYSEADHLAPYLAEADQAFALAGNTPGETYLNQAALLEIGRQAHVDAVHPGYGFLSENAGFAQAVIDAGLTFVGPRPKWLAQMGDKVAARKLMQDHGFPVFPGSEVVDQMKDAQAAAAEIGYPIMVKPTGGGGGMGMQVVRDAASLEQAMLTAQAVAKSAFGNAGVYLERFLDRPRHIEYQILADGKGNAMHLYERECSVQRRNQKLVEESPAPMLPPDWVMDHADLAAQACGDLGYDNVGTVETLYAQGGETGFLETNTRIQVEHGVTEAITGIDLVAQQIRLSQGLPLPVRPPRQGFAMEVRLYAEDAETLLPSTGKLQVFRPPNLFGVRVETGYQQGQIITPFYDAMLAKLIAHGETREMAIGRLLVALRAFEVVGVKTNAPLLMRILQDAEFLSGSVDTGMVDRILGGR